MTTPKAPGGATLDTLDTPCLVLDELRMTANIDRLKARMARLGVTLRPHLKTPKSIEVALRVMASPQGPATVSTLQEAEQFADARGELRARARQRYIATTGEVQAVAVFECFDLLLKTESAGQGLLNLPGLLQQVAAFSAAQPAAQGAGGGGDVATGQGVTGEGMQAGNRVAEAEHQGFPQANHQALAE